MTRSFIRNGTRTVCTQPLGYRGRSHTPFFVSKCPCSIWFVLCTAFSMRFSKPFYCENLTSGFTFLLLLFVYLTNKALFHQIEDKILDCIWHVLCFFHEKQFFTLILLSSQLSRTVVSVIIALVSLFLFHIFLNEFCVINSLLLKLSW